MKKYTYDYPRPALTVDILLFYKENDEWHILLVQRNNPPFEGFWALPGGFVDIDETIQNAAIRELKEETGIDIDEADIEFFIILMNRGAIHEAGQLPWHSPAFWILL